MTFDFTRWRDSRITEINEKLDDILEAIPSQSETLPIAMRYALLNGGKRIRPLLLLATGEMLGRKSELLLDAACSLELAHSYSLVHDDLPAMDDDDLRRGKPSCHKQFDEATAILVGDALQTLAFETLTHADVFYGIRVDLIKILAQSIGANGMVDGQMLDMAYESSQPTMDMLDNMVDRKTGRLLTAAMRMAASLAGISEPTVVNRLVHIGVLIGRSFQMQDDILDVTATTEVMGKTAGSDTAQQKSTYVSVLGLENTQRMLQHYHQKIHKELDALPGRNKETLGALINFVIVRDH
jgi:farnesyl diphosphate synthase